TNLDTGGTRVIQRVFRECGKNSVRGKSDRIVIGMASFVSRHENDVWLQLSVKRPQTAFQFRKMEDGLLIAESETEQPPGTDARQAQRGQRFLPPGRSIILTAGEPMFRRILHIAWRAVGDVDHPDVAHRRELAAGADHLVVRVRRENQDTPAPVHRANSRSAASCVRRTPRTPQSSAADSCDSAARPRIRALNSRSR